MVGTVGIATLTVLGYRKLIKKDVGTMAALEMANFSVPCYGVHQPGIITPPPASSLVAAFDLTVASKADLSLLFKILTQRIEFLMKGGVSPIRGELFPPADSGVLGPAIAPDNLTITAAVGASLFDSRFNLAQQKPKHLIEMASFPNDQLDPGLCHGDLLLQFCANRPDTNIHALRDIIKNLSGAITLRWKIEGFLPPETIKKPGQTSIRNMLGFKDGTANLNTNDTRLMNQIVWVQPSTDEPAWTAGGSYQVVRVIRNLVERWDRAPLQEQEKIIGRKKDSGSPLGMQHESDIPNYLADPEGKHIALDAHIRLANPRTDQTASNRILRRGYNYSRGFDMAGQLDMGLLFVCFQSNLQNGFITVQNRLNGEPLEEYIKPVGGGYFFALPGVIDRNHYLAQPLLEA
jgi:deferrochelatase/peroxidase EfeB